MRNAILSGESVRTFTGSVHGVALASVLTGARVRALWTVAFVFASLFTPLTFISVRACAFSIQWIARGILNWKKKSGITVNK